MKHLFSIALLLLLPLMPFHASAQRVKCEPFRPEAVRLTPSRFYDNFRRDSAWMMSIRVDRLLHSFRTTAGVFSSKEGGYMTMPKLAGWESTNTTSATTTPRWPRPHAWPVGLTISSTV